MGNGLASAAHQDHCSRGLRLESGSARMPNDADRAGTPAGVCGWFQEWAL